MKMRNKKLQMFTYIKVWKFSQLLQRFARVRLLRLNTNTTSDDNFSLFQSAQAVCVREHAKETRSSVIYYCGRGIRDGDEIRNTCARPIQPALGKHNTATRGSSVSGEILFTRASRPLFLKKKSRATQIQENASAERSRLLLALVEKVLAKGAKVKRPLCIKLWTGRYILCQSTCRAVRDFDMIYVC
jgi:hypothetical protein